MGFQHVIEEVNVLKRVEECEEEIKNFLETDALDTEKFTLAQRNHHRQRLYCKSELIRIEIEEKLCQEQKELITPEVLEDEHIKKIIERLDINRANLKLDVQAETKSIFEKVSMVVRMATFATCFFGGFFIIFFLIPVRWFHLYLRQRNWPKNHLPMDYVQWILGRALCTSVGIQIMSEGEENVRNLKDSTVMMFTHGSNLDGLMIQGSSPVTLKFIGKKSLFMIPIVGWAFRWAFGSVPIDRSNIHKAKASLKSLAKAVTVYGRSVAISPEGTRSKTGLLQDFKKGPFYLRDDAGKGITPTIVYGAYELWPPGRLFTLPGKALVRYLPEYHNDPTKSRTENRLALRRIYLKALAENVPDDLSGNTDLPHTIINIISMLYVWVIVGKGISTILSILGTIAYIFGISTFGVVKYTMTIGMILETVMFFTC